MHKVLLYIACTPFFSTLAPTPRAGITIEYHSDNQSQQEVHNANDAGNNVANNVGFVPSTAQAVELSNAISFDLAPQQSRDNHADPNLSETTDIAYNLNAESNLMELQNKFNALVQAESEQRLELVQKEASERFDIILDAHDSEKKAIAQIALDESAKKMSEGMSEGIASGFAAGERVGRAYIANSREKECDEILASLSSERSQIYECFKKHIKLAEKHTRDELQDNIMRDLHNSRTDLAKKLNNDINRHFSSLGESLQSSESNQRLTVKEIEKEHAGMFFDEQLKLLQLLEAERRSEIESNFFPEALKSLTALEDKRRSEITKEYYALDRDIFKALLQLTEDKESIGRSEISKQFEAMFDLDIKRIKEVKSSNKNTADNYPQANNYITQMYSDNQSMKSYLQRHSDLTYDESKEKEYRVLNALCKYRDYLLRIDYYYNTQSDHEARHKLINTIRDLISVVKANLKKQTIQQSAAASKS